jgi:rod shape-determining protein MreC
MFLCGHVVYYNRRYTQNFSSLVSYATYPILRCYRSLHTASQGWREFFADRHLLQTTLADLRVRNKVLLKDTNALKAAAHFDRSTAELLAFKKRYQLDHASIAQILSVTRNDHEQTMLVGAGSRDGVAKNMVALAHNTLLGKVIEVYPWYCKVQLVTDARCKVSVYCAESGAMGIYHGNNMRAASVEHISHLEQVYKDDLIVSSGKGLIFPQGFVLGAITNYVKHDLSYAITVAPLIDVSTLSYCFLISKSECENRL